MIPGPGGGNRPDKEISRNVLASIVEPRMEEVFSLVARELRQVVAPDRLTSGVVLTGGGSMLPGVIELAEQIFDMPARLGEVRGPAHVPDALRSPGYAAGLGLMIYGLTAEPSASLQGGRVRSWLSRIEGWITRKM
jgi:cell division protein FtsA